MKKKLKESWFIQVWGNGKYLDLWTVAHFVLGCTIASGLIAFTDFGFIPCIIIANILMIGWEVYEYVFKLTETIENRITDVIVGIVGFSTTYYVVNNFIEDKTVAFIVFITIFILLQIWGWFAYRVYPR